MMKVRFFSNYDSSDGLLGRFLANYIVNDQQITFTTKRDYDFAVVFNRTNDPIKKTAGIITVVQEPSWSPAFERTDFLTGSDYLLVHDANLFRETLGIELGGEVIECPSYMFYHDRVMNPFWDFVQAVDKPKKLSIIVSHINRDQGNYRKRMGLLEKILDSDLDIEIYGRRLEIDDKRFRGQLDFKYTGLLPYQYSIALENCNEKNYVTEKFVDCAMCNTIPIYNGAPNVGDIYDERFFRTINLDSPTVIDDIREIIKHPAERSHVNREIYRHERNLYTKLKEIILD